MSVPLPAMPTSKKRLNITLPKDTAIFLKKIAIRDDVPQATKATELLEYALELVEDEYFNALAEKRDTPNAKFLSHDAFWSKVL
jgi:predicted DNA-binding protein